MPSSTPSPCAWGWHAQVNYNARDQLPRPPPPKAAMTAPSPEMASRLEAECWARPAARIIGGMMIAPEGRDAVHGPTQCEGKLQAQQLGGCVRYI